MLNRRGREGERRVYSDISDVLSYLIGERTLKNLINFA